MKALTLTQPWATLVAIGAKRIETRSWRTAYRGPLAIHAAKGLASVGGMRGLMQLGLSQPFASALLTSGFGNPGRLPLGAIIATCTLVDCVPTDLYMTVKRGQMAGEFAPLTTDEQWTVPPGNISQEYTFGDYTPNRWAWLLADVQPLDTPVFCNGSLGLWEWQQ
jgi:hypothetical protein